MRRAMKLDSEIAKGVTLFPALDLRDVYAARAIRERMREAANIPRPTDDRITEVEKIIPGPDSESTIPIRIYMPKERERLLPGLVFFHGGGFIMGDLESTHPCINEALNKAKDFNVFWDKKLYNTYAVQYKKTIGIRTHKCTTPFRVVK